METPSKTVTISPESFGAMKRYVDAYRVANVVVKIGEAIKVIGAVLGTLIFVVSLALVLDQSRHSSLDQGIGIIGAVIGVIFGLVLYIFGTLIAAQGQILLASLDVAVCSSPFLSDEQRAKIMSLAKTEKTRFMMEAGHQDT